MKAKTVCSTTLAVAMAAAVMAAPPDAAHAPAQMVVTVQAAQKGATIPPNLGSGDLLVLQDNKPISVVGLQRLPADMSDLQLFIYLDDSTRSASLGTHIPELRNFVQSLPDTAQVAIGYMRNGTFALAQGFTTDHRKAAAAIRLPDALPGENGSPYFALSELVKHWPSKQSGRRAVLMLTDGVDRYYPGPILDDPYVDAATTDCLKNDVQVSSIYLFGAGRYGRGAWTQNLAQSRLMQMTEDTGGYAYFEEFTDPVDIQPFLQNFEIRLEGQYLVTVAALHRGMQPVKVRTELPGVKIEGPSQIYVK